MDLGDDDVGTHPTGAHSDAFSAPAIPGDDDGAPGEQNIGRPNDAIERALPCSVAVVEEVLRLRVIDRDRRKGQLPIPCHGA